MNFRGVFWVSCKLFSDEDLREELRHKQNDSKPPEEKGELSGKTYVDSFGRHIQR